MSTWLRYEAKLCEECEQEVVGRVETFEAHHLIDVRNEGGVWVNGPCICWRCMAAKKTVYTEYL